MIEHLEHDRIDKDEWDSANGKSDSGSIYADAATLDIAAPGWDALIHWPSGARMPLMHRRKYGFSYMYQPIGIQYTPLIGFSGTPSIEDFLYGIPEKFKYWDINLRNSAIQGFQTIERTNMVMDISQGYEALRSAYAKGHVRNLNRSPELETVSITVHEFLDHFRTTTARTYGLGREALKTIEGLLLNWDSRNMLQLLNVPGTRCSAALVHWRKTVLFFKSANDESGRERRGMFRIIDQVVKGNCGSGKEFDMAGSDNPNTQRFYAGFGAKPHVYLRVKRNTLPFPFRLFKS